MPSTHKQEKLVQDACSRFRDECQDVEPLTLLAGLGVLISNLLAELPPDLADSWARGLGPHGRQVAGKEIPDRPVGCSASFAPRRLAIQDLILRTENGPQPVFQLPLWSLIALGEWAKQILRSENLLQGQR